MNENIISSTDATLLLNKLFSEQVPVLGFFVSSTGTRVALSGHIDSVTKLAGLVVAVSSPPSVKTGYLGVPVLERDADFWYGETRDLPEAMRADFKESFGESVLTMRFLDSGDLLAIFFTL